MGNSLQVSVFSFTRAGARLALRVQKILQAQGNEVTCYAPQQYLDVAPILVKSSGCAKDATAAFASSKALVYIGSCGIAVRAIAPLIKHKTLDPAVLVLDEKGRFVIPLLAGHIGGANALSLLLAEPLGAQAVLTTATDVNGLTAIDEWAETNACDIVNLQLAKEFAARLLDNKGIGFATDLPLVGALPKGVTAQTSGSFGLVISADENYQPFAETLNLLPRHYCLGIGCKKGTSLVQIEALVLPRLQAAKISMRAIKKICSVDLKKDELGLLLFAEKYHKPIEIFSAEALQEAEGSFTPSALVQRIVGVDNVCERAAVCGAKGRLVVEKTALQGVTMAVAIDDFIIDFTK